MLLIPAKFAHIYIIHPLGIWVKDSRAGILELVGRATLCPCVVGNWERDCVCDWTHTASRRRIHLHVQAPVLYILSILYILFRSPARHAHVRVEFGGDLADFFGYFSGYG